MGILASYLLFAVTTALCSLYELVMPVVQQRATEDKEGHPSYLLYPVIFIVNAIAAPLVFLSCIIPSYSNRFRLALYKGLYL